eukprot:7836735-Prorocentrum_lima.AAC.1
MPSSSARLGGGIWRKWSGTNCARWPAAGGASLKRSGHLSATNGVVDACGPVGVAFARSWPSSGSSGGSSS